MKINSYIILLFTLSLASCQCNTKYHSYCSTSTGGWHKGDTLSYEIPSNLEKGEYIIEVGIRHSGIYKYKNIWIEVANNFTNSKKIKCDSIQLILADKEGNWLGKGISGLYQKDSLLTKKFTVTNSNKAKISVRHIMRDKNLPGIRDFGIKLIKVSN